MEGEDELDRLIALIPKNDDTKSELRLSCCCGSFDCAFLRQNCLAFEQLEHEIRIAAQLGKALLARHEQYIHDTDRERLEMNRTCGQLNSDKKALEEENAKTLETNRWLFGQLEELNLSVAHSETYIKALETTLDSTRYEFKRLQTLAARTQELEDQLMALEQEQEMLQNTFWTTHELKNKALQKWKTAERRITELQQQMEKIDGEAKEERQRHAEILSQMNRQRAIETESDVRSKGADSDSRKTNSAKCSQFVNKLLHDNLSLHSSIFELRSLLLNSNDEAQLLREQLMEHQILGEREFANNIPYLETDLSQKNPIIPQSIHLHHHYHVPPRKRETFKYKRKRNNLVKGSMSAERNLSQRDHRPGTGYSKSSKVSSRAPNVMIPFQKRWHEQNSQVFDMATSSGPNSPQSCRRNNAIFDRMFDFDSSCTVSPLSSVERLSPTPDSQKSESSKSWRRISQHTHEYADIIYEESNGFEQLSEQNEEQPPSKHQDQISASWESSLREHSQSISISNDPQTSISGIDIQILKLRPSQICLTQGHISCDYPFQKHLESPTMMSLGETIAKSYPIVAQPILTHLKSGQETNSLKLLSRVIAKNTGIHNNIDSSSISSSSNSIKLQSWLRRNWGRKPSDGGKRRRQSRKNSASFFTVEPVSSLNSYVPQIRRSPGINQKGFVPGFIKKNPGNPHCKNLPIAVNINYVALHEVLAEELDALKLD
ncbi:hypothetical protein GcM3_088025 [Golovinomyces cichoracearum]|uniref:Uncharacterized protein n=1 Tax=Golovinomyces cichoracearum TaxID=62708 RepID=A0A420IJC4_9PEZI|nr:hypothetical protein GcM3_088025 [Golovinomyces cichoracearum]